MTPIVLSVLLAALLGAALVGDLRPGEVSDDVEIVPFRGNSATGTLFVLVHGFDPKQHHWQAVAQSLVPHGDVVMLMYPAGAQSNARPSAIADGIRKAIAGQVSARGGNRVVVVAHSMGALLARRAVLDGVKNGEDWVRLVQRLVLLAGINRGWTSEGDLPPDATWWLELQLRAGQWLGKLLRRGELALGLLRGAPFVSDLRLEWMQHMRKAPAGSGANSWKEGLEVVQLLGDIDDFVGREDNEDLRTTAVGKFALLRVRGTGHADIIEFHDDGKGGKRTLGAYRRGKLLLAATEDFSTVQSNSEMLAPPVDPNVTDIVFVLHGIRDIGRWSSSFETEARNAANLGPERKLLFVSPRYGFLGMGPFLFEGVRDSYVRWFMDEYTETVARYPNVRAENIRFFGHSNGTYLLADALRKYRSMRVGNVVLAGSVVASNYDWSSLGDRVGAVRSYAGTGDFVVAWFPRLFELPGFARLGNRIGGGGFHGFSDPRVENVLIEGGHSAFAGQEKDIVAFLMDPPSSISLPPGGSNSEDGGWKQSRSVRDRLLASVPFVLFVWSILVTGLIYIGIRVVASAPPPNWPILVIFALLVVTVLRTV